MQTFLLIEFIIWLIFAHQCLLNSSVIAAAMLAIFTKFNQINALLLKSKTIVGHQFNYFARFHTATLGDTRKFNLSLGQVFLFLMTIYPPVCAFFVMALLLDRVPRELTPFIICLAAGMMLAILGFHFAASLFVTKIHRHSRQLIHLYVHSPFVSARKQLKVSNYIAKFHCRQKYGAMYGNIALISAQSFAKVTIFL